MLSQQFGSKRVVGLDAVNQQTERAKRRHADFLKFHPEVEFFTGLAEKIPFPDNSFSHLISIEAASHFSSMTDFFCEASRVLKPNGKLLVASVFPKNKKTLKELQSLLPKYHVYMNDFTIDKVQECAINFQNVEITSIGDYVWEGLDEWLKQHDELKQSWSRLWLEAYRKDLIDYIVIEANLLSLKKKFKINQVESFKIC
jgi:MPBQ/MSBQ methyltransferase